MKNNSTRKPRSLSVTVSDSAVAGQQEEAAVAGQQEEAAVAAHQEEAAVEGKSFAASSGASFSKTTLAGDDTESAKSAKADDDTSGAGSVVGDTESKLEGDHHAAVAGSPRAPPQPQHGEVPPPTREHAERNANLAMGNAGFFFGN